MNRNAMRPTRAAGFTLVEILVGLTLGLLAIIIMYQVFAVFEGQRRTTISGSDAQTTGLIGLYQMESEGRMAGYGLIYNEYAKEYGYPQSPFKGGILCREIQAYAAGAPLPLIPGMPIRIIDGSTKVGGSAQEPDDVVIMYANSPLAGTPGSLAADFAKAGEELKVANFGHNGLPMNITNLDIGDARGWVASAASGSEKARFIIIGTPQWDKAVAQPPCVRLQATKMTLDASDPKLVVVEHNPAKPANPSAGTAFPVPFKANPVQAPLVFLTGSFFINEYKVDKATRRLIYTDGAASPPINNVLGEEVVTMQARYGVASDAGVLTWVPATGNWLEPWKKATGSTFSVERIRAVRIAVVTRGNLPEKDVVSRACGAAQTNPPSNEVCVWWDDKPNGENKIDVLLGAGWANFRYRVYETTIPIRNALWAGNLGS